jgi:ABC-type bacteriocin/lantibiotic exporter with double-glycine peptidase domain
MVLRYWGRDVSLAEVHERCNVGRDGANARDIGAAARTYGLQVSPYTVDLDELADAPVPAILHWSFSHFVVLERFSVSHATIVDPGGGRREVSRRELSEQFTGILLGLTPGPGFDEAEVESETPSWKVVTRRALQGSGVRRLMAEILAVSLVLQVLGLSVPLLTRAVVDQIVPQGLDSVMTVIGAGIVVLLLTVGVATYLRGLFLVLLQSRLDVRLMVGFFEHVLALPYRYFQERSTGDLLQRLSSNVEIRNILSSQILAGVLDGAMVIVYALVLVIVDPVFGMVALLLGAVQIALLVVTTPKMTMLVAEQLTEEARSQSFLVESLAGVGTLKSSGSEDRALTHWMSLFTAQVEATMRQGRLQVLISGVTSTLQRFAPLVLLWVAAEAALSGRLSLGSALALVSLGQLFLMPLGTLITSGQVLQQVGGHLDRIATVLRVEPEERPGTRRAAPDLEGAIELQGVSFRYDPEGPWTLHGVDLKIEPGQRVALVGPTGSGKSTIVKLLLGFYVPEEGRVLVDGHGLDELDLRSFRNQLGVVMQDPRVFNTSIRRNIALHDPSLSVSAVERAADLAELGDDIRTMPMGFETVVAEDGEALSGGQRQRLALARALVREPRILILDEATSSLDMATEGRVAQHLRDIRCTTVVIAHRLSTVADADVIVVLKDGRVAEHGDHRSLLEQDGVYAELVRGQLLQDTPGKDEEGAPGAFGGPDPPA